MSPNGQRRITTGLDENAYTDYNLRRAYHSMRRDIVLRSANTGISLLLTFLEYPVFLAYLFGFAKISQDPNSVWGPLYVLLLGPLRLGWQALTECSLARADEFTARAGGAWSMALGEFFRITMFGLTSDTMSLVFIVLVDTIRHSSLISLLNRHILITVYPSTSQRVRARVDIVVEICLTILTDAVAATHALAVVTVMMYGFGRENYMLTQSFLSGCQSFRGPAVLVTVTLVCKLILWTCARFMLLRDYSIDLINVLRYLLLKWGAFISFQLASASCVVYVLLLRHAGAQDVISGVFLPLGSQDCVYQLRQPPSSTRFLRLLQGDSDSGEDAGAWCTCGNIEDNNTATL